MHRFCDFKNLPEKMLGTPGRALLLCALSLLTGTSVYADDPALESPSDQAPPDSQTQPDQTLPENDEQEYVPVIRYDEAGNPIDPCRKFDAQYESWLDRSRVGMFRTVCGTGAWFDGFFGESRYDEQTGETYGRFSSGLFYDRRDKFDPLIRLRAKFALAALRNRTSFFLQSGEEDSVVEDRSGKASQQAVETLVSDENTAVFAGFGFDSSENLEKGFSLRAGVRFRTPIEQFVKARYRYGWRATDTLLLRLRPVLYWKSDERFGATLGFQADQFIGDRFMLRWDNSANVTQDQDVDGMRWTSSLSLFHALKRQRAFTYSVFVVGETESDSKLQNYGVEVKFRHRFLRDWLFLEYVGSGSWPRESLEEEREFNPGAGVRFEAYFGENPRRTLR